MSIGQFQLQSAIYTALNVSSITDTLSCGVYDEVIEGNTYPFIALGEETAIDYSTVDLQVVNTLSIYTFGHNTKVVKKQRK